MRGIDVVSVTYGWSSDGITVRDDETRSRGLNMKHIAHLSSTLGCIRPNSISTTWWLANLGRGSLEYRNPLYCTAPSQPAHDQLGNTREADPRLGPSARRSIKSTGSQSNAMCRNSKGRPLEMRQPKPPSKRTAIHGNQYCRRRWGEAAPSHHHSS
jgi:hypothetical protein